MAAKPETLRRTPWLGLAQTAGAARPATPPTITPRRVILLFCIVCLLICSDGLQGDMGNLCGNLQITKIWAGACLSPDLAKTSFRAILFAKGKQPCANCKLKDCTTSPSPALIGTARSTLGRGYWACRSSLNSPIWTIPTKATCISIPATGD